MPKNQNRTCSSLKASRLKTQEEEMSQLEPEGRESRCPTLKIVREEEFPLTQGKVRLFVLFRPLTS